MKSTLRSLTLGAAALAAALVLTSSSEAAVRVRVGVRVAPVRVYRPVRVVGFRPGPHHVYVGGAWVLPPFAGAVWVPGHHDRLGIWIGGHWR